MKKFRQKSKPANLYTKCNELPIHNFNEVATNDDFNYLKKNRNDVVSDLDLQDAWLGILDEFIRISKNSVAIGVIKRKSSMILLNKRLQVFEALKINIEVGNDVDAVCKEYRVKKENIDQHIALVKNEMAALKNKLPNDDDDQAKSTNSETEFDRSIAIIMKNGIHINRFTTVVSEWCAILNILEQQKTAA